MPAKNDKPIALLRDLGYLWTNDASFFILGACVLNAFHAMKIAVAEPSCLYIVATPIGNLGDITTRAVQILSSVNYIAAEDTRLTGQLAHYFNLKTKILSLHLREEHRAAAKIIDLLSTGSSIALVCDAGTPGISDPGSHVVQMVHAAGFKVSPVPGASALTAAYSAAGLTQTPFLFYGFFPNTLSAQNQLWDTLLPLPYALVFFESPHRIHETIHNLQKHGQNYNREIFFARELTKLHEELYRCSLREALSWLEENPYRQQGEYVIILSPPSLDLLDTRLSDEDKKLFKILLTELPLAKAAKIAAKITKKDRATFYAIGQTNAPKNV